MLTPKTPSAGARALSGFANENIDADGLGSNYSALQVKLRRSVGNLTFETNYTWSHEFDDMMNFLSPGFESPLNPKIDRATGDWDVRHNLTGSVVYTMPDLKGSSSLVRGALGGWQTSGILQTRSGLPVNVTLLSGLFGNPERPDYVPGQPLWVSGHSWPNSSYNINAFTPNPAYDGTPGENLGTVGRNSLTGPAFFQFDLSGMKNFAIGQRMKLQFRADIFNIFNHPNFENPDGGICMALTGPPPDLHSQSFLRGQLPQLSPTRTERRSAAALPPDTILPEIDFLICERGSTRAATKNRCRHIFRRTQVRGSMSKPYISNYDKYPVVRVSPTRATAVKWDGTAIGRRLKASVRPGPFRDLCRVLSGLF